MAYAPAAATIITRTGTFRRTVDSAGGKLTLAVELTVTAPEIAPADYPDLRRLLAASEAAGAREVLLRKVGR